MLLFALSIFVLLISAIPAIVSFRNKELFSIASRRREDLDAIRDIPISVLIPARNEESSIRAAIESILSSEHQSFELLVLDDHSEDATAREVEAIACRDSRVKLLSSAPLPGDWNGKQHACWQLAKLAQHDKLLFLDADVRLSSDALDRILAEQHFRQAPLISGFPKQETVTLAEKLLIPLMHYVLLGYLPIDQMRQRSEPGFAAGCGQLFLADRGIYFEVGGHAAIKESRHDGIKLPRAFRKAGFMTDIFDATDIANCRMYHSAGQVCRGLLKNASEGIANERLIVPFSILLIGGSVLPLVLFVLNIFYADSWLSSLLCGLAMLLGWWPRISAVGRFRQSILGALLNPLGVLCFVGLQWTAFIMKLVRVQVRWRGR